MAGIVLANNVFAAETQIEVNGLTVTVNRELGVNLEELGEGAEAYGITIDDRLIGEALTLKYLKFDFNGTGNYLSISRDKTISAKYNAFSKSFTVSSAVEACVDVTNDSVNDICIKIEGANNIYFAASKSLSDSFFGNVFKNHAPFTFSAESESKKIDVKRENSGGRDKYTLTSNSEINSASIIDGTDEIAITKNGDGYNVSGQYKGNSGSTSIPLRGEGVIIEIGVKVDNTTITLDADPSVVEAIAQKLIDEKRNIKEITVKNGVPYEIPSNGSLETIKIGEGTTDPKVRFTLSSDKKAEINKELTIDSQNTGMQIVFQGGTGISGLNNDGIMALPKKVTSVSIPAKEGFAISQLFAIEIGLSDGSLTFDKPAKLVFPGMAKQKVGFKIGDGEFKEITSDCGNESPALNPNSECKFDRGNDLLVFTNHFTKFAVYSESAISTGGGGGGGSVVQYLNISNVNVNLKNDEASITFNVNRPASIVLKYGLGEGVYTNEIKETQLKTSHSFNLINLKENKYYYKIEARDKEGSSASYSQSFTLSGVPAINEINNAANMETSTKVKDQKTYNYNGVITTKPLNEMSKDELFRLFLILLLKSLLAQKGITL